MTKVEGGELNAHSDKDGKIVWILYDKRYAFLVSKFCFKKQNYNYSNNYNYLNYIQIIFK